MTFLLETIIENAPADKFDGLEPSRSRFIFVATLTLKLCQIRP